MNDIFHGINGLQVLGNPLTIPCHVHRMRVIFLIIRIVYLNVIRIEYKLLYHFDKGYYQINSLWC